ncbi:hypothetical protein N9F34_03975 [Alphaproteobacteria bacterium]|nr:hypothetical protein [Alphaproteobacteria bacterium]
MHLIAVLGGISSIFIIVISFLTWQFKLSDHDNYPELFWALMMRAITPDYFDVNESGFIFALIALLMTIFGIFILSTLIGLINTIIETKINAASEGTQRFPFENHFVLMGWSNRVPTILDELVNKNDTIFATKILILLPPNTENKVIKLINSIPTRKGVRIFHRTRNLLVESTYQNINLENAKSILVIGDESQYQGNYRLKILLGIRRYLENINDRIPDIIIEVKDKNNVDIFNAASSGTATPVSVEDIPARLMVQTIQQPSLPSVYEELFSFDGNEIYIGRPTIEGYKNLFNNGSVDFLTVRNSFREVSVFGIILENGKILIAPKSDYAVQIQDKLILISEGIKALNSSFFDYPPDQIRNHSISTSLDVLDVFDTKKQLDILLLGCSDKHSTVIETITKSPLPVNRLVLALPKGRAFDELETHYQDENNPGLTVYRGETDTKQFIDGLNISEFDNIIISHTGVDKVGDEDSATMRAILYIRELLSASEKKPHITMEMTVGRHRELVAFKDSSDFVVSESIASKVLAQYIDDPERRIVIAELLNLGSSDIVIKTIIKDKEKQFPCYGQLCSTLIDTGNVVIGWSYLHKDKKTIQLNPFYDEKLPKDATSVAAIVITPQV